MATPTTHIPTLSVAGWVNAIEQKGDRILAYFIITDHNQTNRWRGEISSLPYLIKQFDGSVPYLQEQITEKLDSLMRRNFGDQVQVSVRVDEIDPEKPTQLAIRLSCDITHRNIVYSLGRQVQFLNGKLKAITELINR